MNTRSIRFQLLSWYVALLMTSFALFGGFMYLAVRQFLEQNLEDNLSRRARLIEHTALSAKEISPAWLRDHIGNVYAPETSSRFVRITRAQTNILYQSGMPQDASFDPNIPMPADATKEAFRIENAESGQAVLIKDLPAQSAIGPLLIEFGAPLAPINTAVNKVILALVLGAPMLIAVAAVGAHKLLGRALSPVVRMARSAEEISLHNLKQRLPAAPSGDELETLALALNRMIARIDDAVEQNRRFVADASHELRTPLAILRAELESVISHNHLSSETRDTLGSNLEEVDRLGKIVEGLFALSRLDAGEANHEPVTLDLARLAATTTEQMCLLAEDKEIALTCHCEEAVLVRGDASRLKQVIVNLVDNAIKYTPTGGSVEVRVRGEGERALFEVKDNGIGIPRRDLPHIFDRFYRVDKARSRDLGGAGLGLSIVKSICDAHDAEITVESQEQQGTRFLVRLPSGGSQSPAVYETISSTRTN